MRSDLNKTVVYEYNLSRFRGKEYLKGFVRAVLPAGGGDASPEAFENTLRALRGEPVAATATTEETDAFLVLARSECAYGLAAVCYDAHTLASFPSLAGVPVEVFRLASGNTENVVLYAPDEGCDLSAFRDVVFLDRPPALAVRTGRANVVVNGDLIGYGGLCRLSAAREDLLAVFAALRTGADRVTGATYAEAAKRCDGLGFSAEEFIFALAVFEALGLVSLEEGRLRVFRGKKTELTNSKTYNAVLRLQELQ